jgi:hypothetical protein
VGVAALTEFSDELASGRRCARLARALAEYADLALGGPEAPRLERHLAHCGRCRARLGELRRQGPRVASALPPALLLPAAERADDVERDVQMGRQLAEAAGDEWLTLWGGFWARVGEGWHALTPVGRLAGTGAAAVLALAGLGSFGHGEDRPVAPEAMQRRVATTADVRPRLAQDEAGGGTSGRDAGGSGGTSSARPRARSARPRTEAHSASARASPPPASRASTIASGDPTTSVVSRTPIGPPPPTRQTSPEGSARAEFEPGPP